MKKIILAFMVCLLLVGVTYADGAVSGGGGSSGGGSAASTSGGGGSSGGGSSSLTCGIWWRISGEDCISGSSCTAEDEYTWHDSNQDCLDSLDENIIDAGDGYTKYYVCPDGSKVEKCGYSKVETVCTGNTCTGGGGCGCRINPEELCTKTDSDDDNSDSEPTEDLPIGSCGAGDCKQVIAQVQEQVTTMTKEQVMEQVRVVAQQNGVEIMPGSASEKAIETLSTTFDSIEIVASQDVGESHKVTIQARKESKFLGIIPIDVDIEAEVDTETGEYEITKKPWWAFFVR